MMEISKRTSSTVSENSITKLLSNWPRRTTTKILKILNNTGSAMRVNCILFRLLLKRP